MTMKSLEATARLQNLVILPAGPTGPEPILGEIIDAAIAISGADFGSVQLVDPQSSGLRIAAQRGFPRWWIDFWNSAGKGQGVCGKALERGTRVIVEDVESCPIFADTPALEIQRRAGVRAVQSTPLVSRSGMPLGVFSTHYRKTHSPDAHELELLDLLARRGADAIENARVTAALRASEERFRALVTASSYVVYCMSPDWRQMRFLDGRGFIADTRAPSETWLERYIHPDDQPHVMKVIQEAIRTKCTFVLEHRVRRVDGTLGWTQSRAVPLLDADGEITEWFGAATDVTEGKEAERKLFEERERLQALLRSLPVGVAFSDDPSCEHITRNPALLAQLGASREDEISASAVDPQAFGRRTRFLHAGRPIGEAELPLQRAIREGRTIPPMELEVQPPHGRTRVLEASGAPIRGEQGEVIGAVSVTVDVTARKQEELEREEARLKDEFLAFLGHELRNPLAAVSNAVQVLSGGVTAEQRASLVELIQRQVGVLRRLVDDLLEVSRVRYGQIRLERESIDLSDLLQAAAAAAQAAVTERAQELVVRPLPRRVLFMADQVRMRQIAANLLDNASKYTERGGRIELWGALEGSEIVIGCRDSGRGIPRGMRTQIFEPLVREEKAGQTASAGLGLGLTLVKRLTELHGGNVTAKSEGPGTGSEFIVRLPLVEVDPTPAPARGAPPSARPRRALCFVVVEDNPDVGQTLKLSLEQAGHRATRFPDGPSALSGVTNLRPDAVVLDIGLPGMDGYEVLAKMRELPELRNTPFIAISGFPEASGTGPRGGGFDHYLVKPVDATQILALVAKRPRERKAEPLRVLLVEDHADLAAVTADVLREEGLEVLTALSGREALDVGARFQPQLILCDMNLPDMKGVEVIRRLRSGGMASKPYAAIVTGWSESEIRIYNDRAGAMGVDEFISKPMTPDGVRTLVRKVKLADRRHRRTTRARLRRGS